MKNKIAIASAFIAASSFSAAEIVINDVLSFEGFVDMSYAHTDVDPSAVGTSGNSNSWAVDQVEISWLFDFEPVTGQIDVQHVDGQATNKAGSTVEQAFATYSMADGAAITAGLYASMLGFEAFEPTGLYQYSTAYAGFGNNVVGTPGYAQGVKYTKEGENTFFGISIQDVTSNVSSTRGSFGGQLAAPALTNTGGFGVEVAGAYTLENGLTLFAGAAYEENGTVGNTSVINGYVTYETGAWLFAAELNVFQDSPDAVNADSEGIAGLIMANYAYSDVASVTGRISFYDQDSDALAVLPGTAGESDGTTFTLAHGYAFTDNLFLVTEVSISDEQIGAAPSTETVFGAVELLFTF